MTKLIDPFGFDTLDIGPLSESWRIERDTPGDGPRRTIDELKKMSQPQNDSADRSRLTASIV